MMHSFSPAKAVIIVIAKKVGFGLYSLSHMDTHLLTLMSSLNRSTCGLHQVVSHVHKDHQMGL